MLLDKHQRHEDAHARLRPCALTGSDTTQAHSEKDQKGGSEQRMTAPLPPRSSLAGECSIAPVRRAQAAAASIISESAIHYQELVMQ